jgi:hypothetical protein
MACIAKRGKTSVAYFFIICAFYRNSWYKSKDIFVYGTALIMEIIEDAYWRIKAVFWEGEAYPVNTNHRFFRFRSKLKQEEISPVVMPNYMARFLRDNIQKTEYYDTNRGLQSTNKLIKHLENLASAFDRINKGQHFDDCSHEDKTTLAEAAQYFADAQQVIDLEVINARLGRKPNPKGLQYDERLWDAEMEAWDRKDTQTPDGIFRKGVKFQEMARNAAIFRHLMENALTGKERRSDSYREMD